MGPRVTDSTIDSPLLHNFTLALTPTDKLVFYGSYTRGLEDANNAPVGAANEGEAPPSIRTEQMDFGLRYKLTPRVNLVAGWFNIEKPYFAVDTGTNVYQEMGIEQHRGYEVSLAGLVTKELNVVAGAVLMEPKVIGEAVNAGLIGERPVTQPQTVVRVNLDYRPDWAPGVSFDTAVNYTDERAVSPRLYATIGDQQLFTEEYATLDIGMRYRFKAFGDNPATLRLLATNVTDEFAWQPLSSGALQINSPRAFQASIAVDF
jgi:iron complex outermembrane receptor protein